MQNEKFTEEQVLWIKRHTAKHMTFAITRPESYRFNAGQYARLGFRDGNGFIWRAYSMISAEYADTLEFFVILIEGGAMSARFEQMQQGDSILLDKTAFGFFLPERFVDGKDLLMLATGSGIAPFLSLLQQPEVWQRFDRIALAHSVSYQHELIFNADLAALEEHPLVGEFMQKWHFVPITTREQDEQTLHHRLPQALKQGSLAEKMGFDFNIQDTRVMICGNPEMVQDTFKTLLEQGFAMHRNKLPGQIMMENGF